MAAQYIFFSKTYFSWNAIIKKGDKQNSSLTFSPWDDSVEYYQSIHKVLLKNHYVPHTTVVKKMPKTWKFLNYWWGKFMFVIRWNFKKRTFFQLNSLGMFSNWSYQLKYDYFKILLDKNWGSRSSVT